MIKVRKVGAVAGLAMLASLILMSRQTGELVDNDRFVVAMWPMLVPLAIAAVGVIRERYWGRWLGLSAGIAVLPWSAAFLLGPKFGAPVVRPAIAFAASTLLLLSLTGRTMLHRYDERAKTNWTGPKMGLLRWTVICNTASAVALYVFLTAYDYQVDWLLAIPAVLLVGVVVGVLLLARQKTIGILVMAVSCILFVPAAGYLVWKEAAYPGEAMLFAVVFLPGIVTGWATLLAFGKPMMRFLRAK